MPILIEKLGSSPDAGVRAGAAWALGEMKATSAREMFHKRLMHDPDAAVRRSTIEALSRIPSPADMKVLLKAFAVYRENRLSIMEALAYYRDALAVQHCIEVLQSAREGYLTSQAILSLKTIAGVPDVLKDPPTLEETGQLTQEWSRWLRANINAMDNASELKNKWKKEEQEKAEKEEALAAEEARIAIENVAVANEEEFENTSISIIEEETNPSWMRSENANAGAVNKASESAIRAQRARNMLMQLENHADKPSEQIEMLPAIEAEEEVLIEEGYEISEEDDFDSLLE